MGTTLQTPLAKEIDVANTKAKYDAQIKKLLSNKNILAWILKYTVKEFSNYSIEQIKPCIEGTPEVSCTPVEPGMTNAEVITGDNTEDVILNEGRIFYDIKFYVILQNSEHTKIIINVEAQKNNTDYNIVARAIF